jgi:hypothetical protein
LPSPASPLTQISRHSDPERSRIGRTAFAFAVAYFLDPNKKNHFGRSGKSAVSSAPVLSGQIRFFPVDRAHSLNEYLHGDAFNRPIVTILSMAKLVKTLISWSS